MRSKCAGERTAVASCWEVAGAPSMHRGPAIVTMHCAAADAHTRASAIVREHISRRKSAQSCYKLARLSEKTTTTM